MIKISKKLSVLLIVTTGVTGLSALPIQSAIGQHSSQLVPEISDPNAKCDTWRSKKCGGGSRVTGELYLRQTATF